MIERTLQFLGPVQVSWHQGQPPRFRSPRTQALLGYLVVEGRAMARDKLALLFWPDELLVDGRANLRRELHNLAQLLPDCWDVDRQMVLFVPVEGTRIDLDELGNLERAEAWLEAAELIGGEFLEGIYLSDNLEFESWLSAERERWRQRAERILLLADELEQKQENYPHASRYLVRLLQLVPWHEGGHRRMMGLLARSGQFSAALKQAQN